MRKFSIAGFLLSGLLFSASAAFGQSKEEIGQMFDRNVKADKAINEYDPVTELIHDSDIGWSKRVWRTIDLSQAGNEFLKLTSVHPSLTDILFNGFEQGAFPAYSPVNDRCNTPMTAEAMHSLRASIASGAKKITSFRVKEDWLYITYQKKMVVHILAIAPVFAAEDGHEPEAAFWVYYPATREYLQKQLVAAPGTHPGNLDEVIEGRLFKSKIDKVLGPE